MDARKITKELDAQTGYWDSVARSKSFSVPLDLERLLRIVPTVSSILDYGCGYGRICAELAAAGYRNIVGVDISGEMVRRGLEIHPRLKLEKIVPNNLPYPDCSFDAVILFAVLTCIPTDEGQRTLVEEIHRVLRPNGILYVSDFLLQRDERNLARYQSYEAKYGRYGVFELPEGAILRHHSVEWLRELLRDFAVCETSEQEVLTMNSHRARIFQYFTRKKQ